MSSADAEHVHETNAMLRGSKSLKAFFLFEGNSYYEFLMHFVSLYRHQLHFFILIQNRTDIFQGAKHAHLCNINIYDNDGWRENVGNSTDLI